jgi:hypothetical protein
MSVGCLRLFGVRVLISWLLVTPVLFRAVDAGVGDCCWVDCGGVRGAGVALLALVGKAIGGAGGCDDERAFLAGFAGVGGSFCGGVDMISMVR